VASADSRPVAKPTAGRSHLQGAPEPIAALNRVRITELAQPWLEREPLVDIRRECPRVDLTEYVCPYLRRTAAAMLNAAQDSLPAGYRLRVGTALRTLAMQRHGWDHYFQRMREEHPQWPLSALRRATNKYFAPYDQKAPPGHCTGGAVDVGLLGPDGEALDLTSPTKGWDGAYTWSDKLSSEAKANRMVMVEAMLGAGFSNCRDEFWHYSYGDSAWAVRVGESECPYGWTYPPVELDASFEGASAADLHLESTRDPHGRVIRAEGSCAVPPCAEETPDGFPLWRLGLRWAGGVAVTLHLHWPFALPTPPLFVGDGKEEWQPLTDVQCESEHLRLHLTPTADRVFLTNCPPPKTD
jgi:D-alanyl-D-alanine dipeptidase